MAELPSDQGKLFTRGEVIFLEGEGATHVYVVESGIVALSIERAGTRIEIAQVSAGQILGEEALMGKSQWSLTAIANNDVRVVPIEVLSARAWIEGSPPLALLCAKSVQDKQKFYCDSVFAMKREADPTPCPPDRVTKLFGVIYHVANFIGTKKASDTTVIWPTFRKYALRTFLESPVRLEAAIHILVKIGWARLEFIPCETDPEAPDELGFVHFSELGRVKEFFEFYRRHFFSGRGGAPIAADEAILDVLRAIDEWNAKGKVDLDESSDDAAA